MSLAPVSSDVMLLSLGVLSMREQDTHGVVSVEGPTLEVTKQMLDCSFFRLTLQAFPLIGSISTSIGIVAMISGFGSIPIHFAPSCVRRTRIGKSRRKTF